MSNIQPYIILNDIDSRTISGLLISSLPPISKPQVRTQVETVDGRDGDLVTPLGFSAYDKVITIGLTYGYDIDDVIEFFNSEGIVTFSNEPDKYYRYAIYEQIDFDKLIRFKKAEVTLHCQPFKFSTTEDPKLFNVVSGQPITVKNNGNTDSRPNLTIIGSGDIDVSLNGSQILSIELEDDQAVIIDSEDMNAYAAQSAIREVVADINPIQDLHGQEYPYPAGGGKNKLQVTATTQTISGVTFTVNSDGSITVNGTATAPITFRINTSVSLPEKTYTFSGLPEAITGLTLAVQTSSGNKEAMLNGNTFTASISGLCWLFIASGTTISNKVYKPQIEEGSTATPYAPYENICEISGFTECNVTRCGKNLLNNPDKTITIGSYVINNVNVPMVVGSYILSFDFSGTSNSSSLRIDDENGTAIFTRSQTITNGHNQFLINLPSKASFVKLFSNAVGTYSKFQIERGNQFTTFEAYNGATINIPFVDDQDDPITVYGGSLNVTTGVLNITHGIKTFDGTLSYTMTGDGKIVYCDATPDAKVIQSNYGQTTAICDYFRNEPNSVAIRQGAVDMSFNIGSAYFSNNPRTVFRNSNWTSVTDAINFFTVNPAQIVYELATPTEIQLTPTQINNLLGLNQLYTDTNGDITVKHKSNGVIVTNTGAIVSFTVAVDDMEKGALLNRLVTGDYDKIRLKKGDNTIVLTGNAQQFVIDKYSRWI